MYVVCLTVLLVQVKHFDLREFRTSFYISGTAVEIPPGDTFNVQLLEGHQNPLLRNELYENKNY